MITTHFDFVARIEIAGKELDIVVHTNARGDMIAWHNPLGENYVKCDICNQGTRVYLERSDD